jgi:hypothetical protein
LLRLAARVEQQAEPRRFQIAQRIGLLRSGSRRMPPVFDNRPTNAAGVWPNALASKAQHSIHEGARILSRAIVET